MKTLHMIIPEAVRPYALAHSFEATQSCRMITSISYYGSETLVVGSRDCNVSACLLVALLGVDLWLTKSP